MLIRRAMLPAALLAGLACFMLYYNYRVFGSVLVLPYQTNRATYAMSPVFVWRTPRPEPVYLHQAIRDFYVNHELPFFAGRQTVSGFLERTTQKAETVFFFF